MNNSITVLVNSCDAYEDTWYPFFKLFSIYWKDCPYRIILNTESKTFEMSGMSIECFQFFKDKKVPYGKRIIRHLQEINTEYVLVLIDDFFLQKQVDMEEIEKCRQWMDKNKNIAYFSFAPIKDKYNEKSMEFLGYEKRPTVGRYKINFQAALWRTSNFLKSWKAHENPWTYERYGTVRSFFDESEYYCIHGGGVTPIDYGAKYGEAWNIVAGLWVKDSVDGLFKKHGIVVDYERRGILQCDIKELPRDHKKAGIKDVLHKVKSYGFWRWLSVSVWRIKRKIRQKFGAQVEADEEEYWRKRLSSKREV